MKKIKVIPRKGLIVKDENRRPIPAEGAVVEDSSFWRRRARDKDVEIEKIHEKKEPFHGQKNEKSGKGK